MRDTGLIIEKNFILYQILNYIRRDVHDRFVVHGKQLTRLAGRNFAGIPDLGVLWETPPGIKIRRTTLSPMAIP